EAGGADAPLHRQARHHPVERHRADRRPGPPAVARGAPAGPFAAGCPRVEAGQAEVAAGLVDEDQARRVDPLDAPAPGLADSLVALAGAQRLFFRVQPNPRAMTRLMVAVETRTPAACSYQAQCSSSVASGDAPK